jgi:hypothetical protein
MSSRSRDAVLWFAAGALLALFVVRLVPAAVQRVACRGGACTTSVARARAATLARDDATQRAPLPRNDATKHARLAWNDAVPDASSPQRDLGPGVYVMRAPEATAARVAPSPAPSDAAVTAPSPDAATLLAKRDEASAAPPPLVAAPDAAAPDARDAGAAAARVATGDAAAVSPSSAERAAGTTPRASADDTASTAPQAAAAAPPQLGAASNAVDATPPPAAAPPQPQVASNAVETTPPAAAPPRNDARAAAAVSPLDGWWLVTNAAQSSRRRPDNGLLVVYRIELRQDGARVFGKGSTWSKNGYVLRPSERTPVIATGTWHDNRIELVLIEHGRRGTRQQRVEWQPTADGEAFEGRFTGDATNMVGSSEAVRELSAPVEEAQQRAEEPRRRRHARWR